jgi:hypothetical protein
VNILSGKEARTRWPGSPRTAQKKDSETDFRIYIYFLERNKLVLFCGVPHRITIQVTASDRSKDEEKETFYK